MRRTLDALDQEKTEQVRATLIDRMRPHRKDDGFYLARYHRRDARDTYWQSALTTALWLHSDHGGTIL